MAVAHRIYAEALLEAAKDKDVTARVREEFDALIAAVEASDELADLLRNPQIERVSKRAALATVLAGASEVFRNFVLLVAEKDRIGELREIHAEWERLLAAEERVIEVELTTAVELSDEEATTLVRKIEDAAGRRVDATRQVDPDLIGGLVLRAGSVRVDGSVRGRLETLRQELLARG
ncbi:MAG: ATP synthase F1 subunit delta [Actinomycetota bacterium]|nr:ATP synthase F1 subunit delta [Actinomycetota bacterium]